MLYVSYYGWNLKKYYKVLNITKKKQIHGHRE